MGRPAPLRAAISRRNSISMQRTSLLILAISCALASAAYAQAPAAGSTATPPSQAPNGAPAKPSGPDTSAVPADAAVITLNGACKPATGSTTPPEGCVNTVTKAQFEKLMTVIKPESTTTPEMKRNFAQNYAKLLVFSDAARQLGLENDPRVLEIMKVAKNQILLEALNQHYSDEYSHLSDQQLQQYYDQNAKKYQESTLIRVIVPKNTGSGDKPKPSDQEQQAYVETVRKRLADGADPALLEKEVMEHQGIKTPAPDVNIGAKRPGTLPVAHETVFDLKAGEVSQPFSDPAAFYLYKVVSVKQVPLSEVKTQITNTLKQQLMKDKMEEIQNSVKPELNDAYFGPAPAPVPPRGPMGANPPGGSAPQR